MQRFETNLVTKKIGNGFQTIFGSEEIAKKFLNNQKKSFFRIELRYVFDERDLSFTEENAEQFHKEACSLLDQIQKIVYKSDCVREVKVKEIWSSMWKQATSYLVVSSKNFVTMIYG